jgi:hypothetical protein
VLYCTILYCRPLCCTVTYCSALEYTQLYCTELYCIELCCSLCLQCIALLYNPLEISALECTMPRQHLKYTKSCTIDAAHTLPSSISLIHLPSPPLHTLSSRLYYSTALLIYIISIISVFTVLTVRPYFLSVRTFRSRISLS